MMIQTVHEIIPESIKVMGWFGGAGFTVWIFKMAFEMFRGSKKNGNGKAFQKTSCIDSAKWALHDNCSLDIKKANEANVALTRQLVESATRQEALLKKISDNLS